MDESFPILQPANPVVAHLIDQLRRHPKRVVFTEGEDIRIIRVAARLVSEQVVAPILLGNRERIRAMAAENGVSMKFIHVIDPPQASDFKLFCQRVENMDRYRTRQLGDAKELVSRPHYFGALMVQYGQADALIGGNQAIPSAFFRALINTIKPEANVSKIFGVSLIIAPHLSNLGESGMLFMADTALLPNPEVQDLATMAVQTGQLAQHFLGRTPVVALLSHSTLGSAPTADARRMAAATELARSEVLRQFLDIKIEGELQADVALDPTVAEVKVPGAGNRPSADVLIFPNLDAAHISLKLLQHVAGAQVYGQIICGLTRPAAQIARTATEETIFGTTAAIAVEAIKFHQLHPDSDF